MKISNLINNFNYVNFVGRNTEEKKNILSKIANSKEYSSYYIGSNSYLYEYSYINPIVMFIIKYLNIDFDDGYEEIRQKINQKIGKSCYEEIGEEIILFLFIFIGIPGDLNNKSKKYASRSLYSLYNEFIPVINKLFDKISSPAVIILDNYDYFDKWTKKLFNLYIFENHSNIKFIIFSEIKIKMDKIEKYVIFPREKLSLNRKSISFYLKFTAFTGYFLNYRIIKFLLHEFSERSNYKVNIEDYFNQIAGYKFIYDNGTSIFFLNRRVHDRIISLTPEKEKIEYYKILSSLIDKYLPEGLYFKLMKYYYASITENKKYIEKSIRENIVYFKKFNSEEHLLFFYQKMYKLNKDKIDTDLIIDMLELYKSLDKYKEGFNFIKKINSSNCTSYLKNTIKKYLVYFKRMLGKNKGLIEELSTYKEEAFKKEYYDNYAFFVGEKIFLHYIKGEYSKSDEGLDDLNQYLHKLSDISKAESYYNLKAILLKEKNNIESAIKDYKSAIKLAEKHNNIRLKLTILNNLGELFLDTGQLEQAEMTFKEALNLAIKNESIDNIAILKMNLGNLYFIIDEDHKAYKLVQESLKLSRIINKNRYILQNQYYIAYYYFKIGKFNDALLYATNIEKIVKEKGFKQILNYIYLLKSDIYYYKENYEKSEEYFYSGFKDFTQKGNFQLYYYIPLIIKILLARSKIEEARKLVDKYLEEAKKYNIDAWFYIKIYQIKLSKNDKVEKFKKILKYADSENKRGDIYYEMWRLTGNYTEKIKKYYSGYECFKYRNRLKKIN